MWIDISSDTRICLNANKADRLTIDQAGSSKRPVYFVGGVPLACTNTFVYQEEVGDVSNLANSNLYTLKSGDTMTGNLTAPAFVGPLIGNADTATALTTNAGSSTRPVYFSSGKPVQCGTSLAVSVTGSSASCTGNAATASSAAQLTTARTIRTNLASTSTASFNGTANVTPGVTGILGTANGGTGLSALVTPTVTWTAGTTAGPTLAIKDSLGKSATAVAIPSASGSASGVVTTGTQTFAGGKTFSGTVTNTNKVVISYVQDVAAATANTGSLIIGNPNGQHIAFDDNEIMAKSGSGATAGVLYLNNEGGKVQVGSGGLYGAVWNDYAEFRAQKETIEPGYCVASADNGKVYKTTEKFQACDGIVSDTAGFFIGETDECKTPLAVAGRVLAYFHGNREDYHAGDTVCAGPEGKVMKMTREEIKEYPDRIVGIVSEIPEYKIWGSGNVEVNNRIWIKVK